MALFEITSDRLAPLEVTTYAASGLYERGDLQRLLKANISAILPDVLVIAEEFGDWEGSYRRIDLLCLDKSANLVVVELKRTEDGGHMELQAIRYAAMVSTMTFDGVVDTYERFLQTEGQDPTDARTEILRFIGRDDPGIDAFGADVRIVLVSSNFSKELTTAVMWLNRHLDITCIRMVPYSHEGRIFADVQQIIPLPEAEEYQVRVRNKEHAVRQGRFDLANLTGTRGLQLEYWTAFVEYVAQQKATIRPTKPRPQNWMNMSFGRAGFSLIAVASTWNTDRATYDIGEIKAEITITDPNNKVYFDRLMTHKAEIEAELGYELNWYSPQKSSKVHVRHTADIQDRDDWPNQFAWLLTKLEDLRRVFGPRVKEL